MPERDRKILAAAEERERYMAERRAKAAKAYLNGLIDMLELLREDVSGIVAAAQAKTLEEIQSNRTRIEKLTNENAQLRVEIADLRGKQEALHNRVTKLEQGG